MILSKHFMIYVVRIFALGNFILIFESVKIKCGKTRTLKTQQFNKAVSYFYKNHCSNTVQ